MLQSILQTFYILFKSDAKDVKKGTEEAKKSTDGLSDSLKKVNLDTDRVGESFVAIGRSLAGVVAAFMATGSILGNLKQAYDYTLQLKQSSEALNVNASDLDAWGRVVTRTGGTVQGFIGSVKSLAQATNLRYQDAIRLLPKIADIFRKAGADKAIRLGQNFGLDESLVRTLMKGGKEVERLVKAEKELGVVNKQNEATVGAFNDAITNSRNQFNHLWMEVNDHILPVLTELIIVAGKAAEFMSKHSRVIVGAFIGIGIAAAIALAPILAAEAGTLALYAAVMVAISGFALFYDQVLEIYDELKKFPAFNAFVKGFFNAIKFSAEAAIFPVKTLIALFQKMKQLFNFGSKHGVEFFKKVKEELTISSNSPVNALPYGSPVGLFGSQAFNTKQASVQTGDIIINTQATDSKGIAMSLKDYMENTFRQATGQFDDGQRV